MPISFTARLMAAAIMLLMLGGDLAPAKAQTDFGLYVGRPGFSLYFGRNPGYRYAPYRYYDYNRYYTPAPQYRPGRCEYWSRRCAASWGYGNKDYRGCMRYHGCR